MTELLPKLVSLYGLDNAPQLQKRIQRIIDSHRGKIPARDRVLTEQDAILITYADQVREGDKPPLKTLENLCEKYLKEVINGIHILPFFPFSSDDGFSVIDYRKVKEEFGDWADIGELGSKFLLMIDAVVNHISSQSAWFQSYLRDEQPYRDYFITLTGDEDLAQVVRPRASAVQTLFETPSGIKRVWTTFSPDQIDLDFHNPEVLLEVIDLLLTYVENGAQFIRLDAVAYIWKEFGTSCIHLRQAHLLIQVLRAVLDMAAPQVALITETNVPHQENISYFGDGENEAQLVYNFALPPLVLHTFHVGNAELISNWVEKGQPPPGETTFINFLASHDGIGLSAARGILSETQIESLIDRTLECGGLVSYKEDSEGHRPYELNINFLDALSNPSKHESLEMTVNRCMCAQSIMLCLKGVPAIYFHSLFGSRGWPAGVEESNQKRSINRQKLLLSKLENELADHSSLRYHVFQRYSTMLRARAASSAFHPLGAQNISHRGASVFAILRTSPVSEQRVLCLHNVSDQIQTVSIDFEGSSRSSKKDTGLLDLITNKILKSDAMDALILDPYQTVWLTEES
ncbi:MAG: sugar phosphorylase [Anaerolineales bacterium]